jgi:hypothetical protein
LGELQKAVSRLEESELILVDNNGRDQTDENIYRFQGRATIVRSAKTTVGGVRNEGVSRASHAPNIIAFVDSDCLVPPDFCENLVAVFNDRPDISIAGCKVVSPADGHWTERASDALHRQSGDGPRAHLNSGCLAIRAEVFVRVGGFSETLPANEDYDLCDRVTREGGLIWQFECLRVVHLGNPKSLPGFFRRIRWHGRGAIGSDGRVEFTAMAIATLVNSACLTAGVGAALTATYFGRSGMGLFVFCASVVMVPLIFWVLRMIQLRRWIPIVKSVALMQITFLARQIGMAEQYRTMRRL